jgi:hypothetical protein
MSYPLFSALFALFHFCACYPLIWHSVHFYNVSFSIILVSFQVCTSVHSSFLISHLLYVMSLILLFICLFHFCACYPLLWHSVQFCNVSFWIILVSYHICSSVHSSFPISCLLYFPLYLPYSISVLDIPYSDILYISIMFLSQ